MSFDDLGYFDSDESYASDYVDDSSESEEFYKPVNNMNNMRLPVDTMKEILYSADIETYINLCNTSKEFKKLCNNTWKLKFNQYGTEKIDDFNHGVRLYKKYLQDLKLYDTVDIFMKEFEKTPRDEVYVLIKLTKPITHNKLQLLINNHELNNEYSMQVLNFKFKKYGLTKILDNNLTYNQLRHLIFKLFEMGYLDRYNRYFYNDYKYYVTEDDSYFHPSLRYKK